MSALQMVVACPNSNHYTKTCLLLGVLHLNKVLLEFANSLDESWQVSSFCRIALQNYFDWDLIMQMKQLLSWFALALFVHGMLLANSWGFENGASDWPTYRGGNDRLASTSVKLNPAAKPSWTYVSPAAPKMSWGSAEGRVIENQLIGNRNKYDDSLQPVVVGEQVFFGSSVDHHLHCLDLKTGKERWTYAVRGPIPLAPAGYQNRVYFGADDGFAYCLSAADGSLVWKVYGSSSDSDWLLARGYCVL